MSGSEQINENFMNDLRELLSKYNIQQARMSVEMMNEEESNKDNGNVETHNNKTDTASAEVCEKTKVNVIIRKTNDVTCPSISPNTFHNIQNANENNEEVADVVKTTKVANSLPSMETHNLISLATNQSCHTNKLPSTKSKCKEEHKQKQEAEEVIYPHVASQPAAPLAEIPPKQDVLPHSHSVSERRTHLSSPSPIPEIRLSPTNTKQTNMYDDDSKEHATSNSKATNKTLSTPPSDNKDNNNQPQNSSSSTPTVEEKNTATEDVPIIDEANNTINLNNDTHKSPSMKNNTMSDTTITNMAALSGLAIPDDLQKHLAQHEQRQKRIDILNTFVGRSAILQDKAERERTNREAGNSSINNNNNTISSSSNNRRISDVKDYTTTTTSTSTYTSSTSLTPTNYNQNNKFVEPVRQEDNYTREVKFTKNVDTPKMQHDKLPPINYNTVDVTNHNITTDSTSSNPKNLPSSPLVSLSHNTKRDSNNIKIDNSCSIEDKPNQLSRTPNHISQTVCVEIDAKKFTDICRENTRQAAKLKPHLSESFAPLSHDINNNNNKNNKINTSNSNNDKKDTSSALSLKELLKEQQKMEEQSREDLAKHAELMAKAKAVIEDADHVKFKPHTPENEPSPSQKNMNANQLRTNSLPYSLTHKQDNNTTSTTTIIITNNNNDKYSRNENKVNNESVVSKAANVLITEELPVNHQNKIEEVTSYHGKTISPEKESNDDKNCDECRSSDNTERKRKSQIELMSITLPNTNKEARSEAIEHFAKEPTLIQYLQGKDKYEALLASQKKELTQHEKEQKNYKELVNQAVEFNKKIGISEHLRQIAKENALREFTPQHNISFDLT